MNQDMNNRWNHTFGYFWYDEAHIFEWTQRDFDLEIKKYVDSGVNHIITFSIAHFRWSFQPWWVLIHQALEKLTRACHKQNVLLTEHHSATYLFSPDTPERLDHIEKRFFKKRNGSYKHWPDFRKQCLDKLIIDGKDLKEMLQIDPISGNAFVKEQYAANIVCPNHPDFTPRYLKYLEQVYRLGVDGIMTDDMSMSYGNYDGRVDVPHACACYYCREKFKNTYSYELPACGDEWAQWRRKRDTPDYIAWIKFRKESVREFHVKVKEHYEKLNLKLWRPNYSATTIHWNNPGGYCFDLLPALDWVMIENTFEHIMRYSWPEWMIEHNHRFALARHRQIPAVAMFYPHKKSEVEFCWAMALNSGLKYLGTANCEPVDLGTWETPLRQFEQEHQEDIINAGKLTRTAFYFSRASRDLYPDYESKSRTSITSWMIACELENVPYDLLLPEELDDLEKFELVILNEAAVMSEDKLGKFKKFVKNGGKIIWIGVNAQKDETFKTTRTFNDIWGFEESSTWANYGKGQVCSLNREEWSALLRRRVSGHFRWIKDNEPNYDYQALSSKEITLYTQIARFISKSLSGGSDLMIENAERGLLCHTFINSKNNNILLHFLNAAGTLDKPESGYVMHRDPIPLPKFKQSLSIKLRKPEIMMSGGKYQAFLCVPGQEDISLKLDDLGEYFHLEIKPGSFTYYALIKIGEYSKN